MIVKQYTIIAASGLHARPATMLIKLAKSFESIIQLKKDDKHIVLNSVLNLLGLALKQGDGIMVMIEGPDENDAAAELDFFFNHRSQNL